MTVMPIMSSIRSFAGSGGFDCAYTQSAASGLWRCASAEQLMISQGVGRLSALLVHDAKLQHADGGQRTGCITYSQSAHLPRSWLGVSTSTIHT